MGTFKTGIVEGTSVVQIEFSPSDLAVFAKVATDPDFARSMAITLWAVGNYDEQNHARNSLRTKMLKAASATTKALDLWRRLPPTSSALSSSSILTMEAHRRNLDEQRARMFPKRAPVDIAARRVLHAVAHQMRKRGHKVSCTVVASNYRQNPFISICITMLSIIGKLVSPAAIKKQAGNARILQIGKSNTVLSRDTGWDGILLSEGNFTHLKQERIADRLYRREYIPRMGARGFQFQLMPVTSISSSDFSAAELGGS